MRSDPRWRGAQRSGGEGADRLSGDL